MTCAGGGAPHSVRSSVVWASLTRVGVVAAGEGAVQGGADAGVGLGAGDDEPADAEVGQHALEVGVLEGVAVALVDQRLGLVGRELGDDLPARRCRGTCSRRSAAPRRRGRRSSRALSTRPAMLATTASRSCAAGDDAVLDVDDEQGGVRAVLQRAHSVIEPSRSAGGGGVDAAVDDDPLAGDEARRRAAGSARRARRPRGGTSGPAAGWRRASVMSSSAELGLDELGAHVGDHEARRDDVDVDAVGRSPRWRASGRAPPARPWPCCTARRWRASGSARSWRSATTSPRARARACPGSSRWTRRCALNACVVITRATSAGSVSATDVPAAGDARRWRRGCRRSRTPPARRRRARSTSLGSDIEAWIATARAARRRRTTSCAASSSRR